MGAVRPAHFRYSGGANCQPSLHNKLILLHITCAGDAKLCETRTEAHQLFAKGVLTSDTMVSPPSSLSAQSPRPVERTAADER